MSAILEADGYLYEYMTPSGRSGPATVARVPVTDAVAFGAIDESGRIDEQRPEAAAAESPAAAEPENKPVG
ncbi:DUF4185 domain-containing protein [Dietzia sp. NCCP-2495]|uniref:DUF4185 domain-containing protein n=1 Tax=Dietzia sp. NCCP-2495 TaxID=2934675 RepID=UPI002232B45A|nr:DUF4185 domain-containing protein [Dietzia sp. NCCP-2495]